MRKAILVVSVLILGYLMLKAFGFLGAIFLGLILLVFTSE